ncbi:hypothetical protein [Terriglobus sp.]|uniref:hypothetical protein n=1 Tax=Terriglobus sp. TaxID=1889013 RepID=UPI003AFFAC18
MARGWESKSVEGQQEGAGQTRPAGAATPQQQEQTRQRRLQGLQMQRERILSERTSSPHRRSALQLALADVERELEQLGWTIHI